MNSGCCLNEDAFERNVLEPREYHGKIGLTKIIPLDYWAICGEPQGAYFKGD